MGSDLGLLLGVLLGEKEGLLDGSRLGPERQLLGTCDGPEGTIDGLSDGVVACTEGLRDGFTILGCTVGCFDKSAVGVGTAVGMCVGVMLGGGMLYMCEHNT